MPFVQAGGLNIHYRVCGQGQPLICLHGMSNHSLSWAQQMEGLKHRFTVIAWDAPGYGLSDDPPRLYRSFAEFAEVLQAFMEALALESVVLLGHSMGAAIAVELCANNGGRVASLILSDATRGAAALSAAENERRLSERIRSIETTAPGDIAQRRVHALLAPGAPQAVVDRAREIMSQVRPSGYKSVAYALSRNDQMQVYPRIRLPTLVICGELDRITPVGESRIIHELVKGSEMRIIPGTGHLCYQEDPETFNRLLCEFVPKQSRA